MDSDTVKFKVYCVEEYRKVHVLIAPQTLDLFEKYGVFGPIGTNPIASVNVRPDSSRYTLHELPLRNPSVSVSAGPSV